jgi:hypothetical protein
MPEEWGGYEYIWSSSSRDCEPLDHHPVSRQPSDSTGVAQDLIPSEQRKKTSRRYRDSETSEFGILESHGPEIG